MKNRLKPLIKDKALYWRYAAQLGKAAGSHTLALGPLTLAGALMDFPWLKSFLNTKTLYDCLVVPRTGAAREANAFMLTEMVSQGMGFVNNVVNRRDRLILNEDLVPPEILYAMGLESWFSEFLGFLLPMLDPSTAEHYLDVAENHGVPSDICSLPRHIMGIAHAGHLPRPAALVTSNSPCDGGMASYTVLKRRLNCPAFYLDVPYHFHTDRAIEYFIGELQRMIAWLEENTPGRMDWDRLAEVCDERNRMTALESDLWDMISEKPAPMAAEPNFLTHLWGFIVAPGKPDSTRMVEKVTELARKNLLSGTAAVPGERFRTFVWGVWPVFLTDFWSWCEKKWGVSMILDSLSFNRLPPIRTSSRKEMLEDLSRLIMAGPMARHSRGPMDNYFDDMFFAIDKFSIDFLIHSGHTGCKNSHAMVGILREKCRERGIPMLILNYDMSDARTVPGDQVRAQMDHFMENVMQAEKSA